ncbi:iron-containing alcohol dehydrogenase (plasmid) [Telmatobacter bradus]|uniref:iron-containing alcohol dehydrogenase n=1 Tax=Telmatobacter bradus TaxID=474953 RepID=UPI003B42D935
MQNFVFQNPVRIVFGKDTIKTLDELIAKDERILILYGGNSARSNGTLDEVKTALGSRTMLEFGGIEPNPTFETLMQAIEIVRKEKISFLLAVGGGSVIDGTKFVAATANYAGDPWKILETMGKEITEALPFGTVLTLPATGSEMNNGSVITRKSTQSKLPFLSDYVFPKFSILDPSKTLTLPMRQVANGIVDSYVHILEQYLTYPAGGMVQDRLAEGMLQTLIEIGPQILANPQDYDLRANLMWVATLALNGLIGAGVPQDWATHMLGHELTARFGIDHARTLASILPAALQERRASKQAKLLQYAERVWKIVDGSEDERIDQVIARTAAFFESLGVPTTLKAYEVKPEEIDSVLSQLEAHGTSMINERMDMTLAIHRRILQHSIQGE